MSTFTESEERQELRAQVRKLAGSAIATLPLLVLFVIFSRQLIAGLTAGAVK